MQKNKNFSNISKCNKNVLTETNLNKKKSCIIKLQVNKLVKPQFTKINQTKTNKNPFIQPHQHSQYDYDLKIQDKNKKNGNQQKKITKTFQELYFQKIKQLRLEQQNFLHLNSKEDKIGVQRHQVSPCKNNHQKNNINQEQPQSTKSQISQINKQNIYLQKECQKVEDFGIDKFFKKQNKHIPEKSNLLDQDLSKEGQKTGEEQKAKKTLRLKRYSIRTKSDQIPKIKTKKTLSNVQNITSEELRSSFSQISPTITTSTQLKTFKVLNTPFSQKVYEHTQTSHLFKEIIDSKIDHSNHQHIWGESECFLSFQQFQLILQSFGFEEPSSKQVGFYVHKLWQNLGGNLYGGVVRKNIIELLNIILQDERENASNVNEIAAQEIQLKDGVDLIQKSSLRLVKMTETLKERIKKLYFPLKLNKIASNIQRSNLNEFQQIKFIQDDRVSSKRLIINPIDETDNHSLTPQNKLNIDEQALHLQNNPYLDSSSVKNRLQQMSPDLIPATNHPLSVSNTVTDFSPKLPMQQYQHFKSTSLEPSQFLSQKLPTQQQFEISQNKSKRHRKALLSIDVNLGEGIQQKLVVYEDQDPFEVSMELKNRYNIDEEMRQNFQMILKNHMKTLLFKIEEVSEQLFEDSVELTDEHQVNDFILMDKY